MSGKRRRQTEGEVRGGGNQFPWLAELGGDVREAQPRGSRSDASLQLCKGGAGPNGGDNNF